MMRRMMFLAGIGIPLLLSACTHTDEIPLDSADPELHVDTTTSDGHADPFEGENMSGIVAFLSVGASEQEIASVESDVLETAPTAQIDFGEGWLDVEVLAGHEGIVDRCLVGAHAYFDIWFDTTIEDGQKIVDVLTGHSSVVGMDAFGYENTLGYPGEGAYEDDEARQIACESTQIIVYVDGSEVLSDVRGAVTDLSGVVATAVESFHGDFFTPDLSRYPELAACYAGQSNQVWVYFEDEDQQRRGDLVESLSSHPGVVGFSGWGIDPSLDPIAGLEEDWEDNFELCQGVEGYVHLAPDITDEQAAVIVARAAAIEGVADYNLVLIDPADIEPCGDFSSEDDVVELGEGEEGAESVDCFEPQSELIIFRGDKTLATPQLLADELCDLPGVLSMDVYDREGQQEFADPYQTCGTLHLEVYLNPDIDEARAEGLRGEISSLENVADAFGPHYADYENPEREVVVGELPEPVCTIDVETDPSIGVELHRMTREAAEGIASTIGGLEGVSLVLGNAIGLQPSDPRICGYDGMFVALDPEMREQDRQELWGLFESRPDVLAVVMEEPDDSPGHEPSQSVMVKFNTDTPPGDIEDLAQAARSVSGVQQAEIWYWWWEDFAPIG